MKVAIFDIDGTIFRSSLLIELTEAMIEKGLFPPSAKKGYEKELKRWQDRKDGYENYIGAVVEVFMKYIKGVSYGNFMDVSEEIVEFQKNKVYQYTRDLIAGLKKKKYFLLAISQSPKGTLDKFCETLGFNKVYGRFYEIDGDDKFTGKVTDEHLIANKANIIKRAMEKEGFTLKGSIGIGDTEGDIPMLEMVENPICFNPNAKLYKYAKINKWQIIVERKDVVYKIA